MAGGAVWSNRAPFFDRREEPRAIRASSTACSISDDPPLPQALCAEPASSIEAATAASLVLHRSAPRCRAKAAS